MTSLDSRLRGSDKLIIIRGSLKDLKIVSCFEFRVSNFYFLERMGVKYHVPCFICLISRIN